MKKLIAFIFAAVLTAGAWAHQYEATVNGVKWYYNRISDGKGGYNAEITYRGSYSSLYSNEYSGSLTIPSTLGGYKVTTIGDYAFCECDSLTSVTIPNSVISIGEGAFDYCSSLTSITIPDSVTTIDAFAFYYCSSLTSVTIPNGVTTIGLSAFYGTPFYNNQPDGLVILGNGCLYNYKGTCPSSVTIPDSVTTIGECAFYNCSSLTSITIPDGVTTIGDYAFCICRSLTTITIPNSVTSIGSSAFDDCSSLASVTIPNSVTTIGSKAFDGCSSLKSFIVGEYNPNYKSINGLLCSKEGKTIVFGVNGDVTIPDGVTEIGDWAFSGCSSLTSITIPDSVTTIGDWAFRYCSSLTSVTIPNSVRSIGYDAFDGCSSLTSVTIPACVEKLSTTFADIYENIEEVAFAEGVRTIRSFMFSGCNSLTSVTIPESVTSIGESAFSGCSSLTSVTIPDSVTSIGSSAFIGCRMLGVVYTNVESSIKSLMRSSGFDVNSILFVVPQAPIITPLDGAILSDSSTVVIKSELEGSTIYYTIDGSRPTCQSNEYTRKFRIDKKCTIRAIIAINGIQSDEIIARYAFGQCPNPEIVIQGEEEFLHIGRVVTINYDCDEGIVCYTIDGSEPTADSPIYDGPIVIDDTTTIRAKAFSDRYFDSDVVELTLVREWEQLPKVEIVSTDKFVGETSVSLSCEDGYAAIYYTLDGSEPTIESMRYTTPFVITEGKTIKAVALRDDYLDSEVATRVVCQAQVASPVISAADSFQGSKTFVSLECVDGGVVRYTLDGTTPTSASAVYSEPFAVTATTVVTAYVTKVGYIDSAVSTKTVTKVWCIGDTMGAPDQVFTTEGALGWVDDNGAAMKSGKIADNQESKLRTVVAGEGSLSFEWKVSCEYSGGYYDYDRLELRIDGVISHVIDGIGDWQAVEVAIEGEGDHVVEWVYIKDSEEFDGEDCAWVRKFAWNTKPSRPETVENASTETQAAFDKWIADNGVANPSAVNVNAFVLGLAPSATEEAIQEKVEEELANLDLGKLVEGDISAAVAEIQAKYPNAKVDLAPVEDINTSARLFKLVIKLR